MCVSVWRTLVPLCPSACCAHIASLWQVGGSLYSDDQLCVCRHCGLKGLELWTHTHTHIRTGVLECILCALTCTDVQVCSNVCVLVCACVCVNTHHFTLPLEGSAGGHQARYRRQVQLYTHTHTHTHTQTHTKHHSLRARAG